MMDFGTSMTGITEIMFLSKIASISALFVAGTFPYAINTVMFTISTQLISTLIAN